MRTDENDITEPRYKLAQSEAVSTWETLGEKKIHAETGADDFTRAFQNAAISRLSRALLENS